MTVRWEQVLRWRFGRHLLASPGDDPVSVAGRVCGVHAQLAASAVTALDLRTAGGVGPADVDAALHRDRTLVKTWAARGTLHLLPAADLPTWVAAMSTRARERTGSWLRYHEVTARQMTDLIAAAPDVLGAEPLTREELSAALVEATGHKRLAGPLTQGFGAVLKPVAFRGLLCFGPPRGRNVTFVAPRAWLGPFETPDADDAIDTLVLAHAGAFGPSDAAGFARWFDLRPSLAKKAFARLTETGALVDVDVEGTPGSVPADLVESLRGTPAGAPRTPRVRLLPAFDPYVVGSTGQLDRLMPVEHKALVSRPQGWISPTVVVDGRIVGVWARDGDAGKNAGTNSGTNAGGGSGAVEVTPFAPLPRGVRAALDRLAPGCLSVQSVVSA